MKTTWAAVLAVSLAGTAWADDDTPQGRGVGTPRAGGRVWFETELLRGQLEATSASGTDPVTHTEDVFNDDIDTFLQQGIAWVAGGYELDMGLTIYGKLGYAFPTLIQEMDPGSILVGTDVHVEASPEPFVTLGLGVSLRRELAGGLVVLGRAEFTAGSGDCNDVIYHDIGPADGDFDYRRLEIKAAVGLQSEHASPYLGVRYNWITVTMDLTETGAGPESLDVDYELKTPIGVFLGVTGRVADRTLWHAEIGFVDAITFEAGVGMAF